MNLLRWFRRKRMTPLRFCQLASSVVLEAGNATFQCAQPLLQPVDGQPSSRSLATHTECIALYMHWASRGCAADDHANKLFAATANHILEVVTAYLARCWMPDIAADRYPEIALAVHAAVQDAELFYGRLLSDVRVDDFSEMVVQFSIRARGRIWEASGNGDVVAYMTSGIDEQLGKVIINSMMRGGFEKLVP